jgi:hypothetical protein
LEKPGEPRASAWLAAVLIRERDSQRHLSVSVPTPRARKRRASCRGLKNVIAYNKSLELK